MKRFKFRLQQVLEYRNSMKKEKERELAICNAELFTAEDHLEQIVNAQDSCQPPEAVVSMAELLINGTYQQRLREALEFQRIVVQQATEAVDAARDAYIEKAVEAEILETLKEKKFEAYKLERSKSERKQLDEMTVQRYGMKKRSNGGNEI